MGKKKRNLKRAMAKEDWKTAVPVRHEKKAKKPKAKSKPKKLLPVVVATNMGNGKTHNAIRWVAASKRKPGRPKKVVDFTRRTAIVTVCESIMRMLEMSPTEREKWLSQGL